MIATKLVFNGSKISPDSNGIIRLNVLFNNNILVSMPNNTWADNEVLFNNKEVNLIGEYDPIINKAIKAAYKLFPNWAI